MLKVLLADDEPLIKTGLRNEIDWESLGCLIVGEAADGVEALELIRREEPDIVISDVRMPVRDGLSMMEESRKESPDLAFLFISGHDEFAYVQKALKMGALDYILKPIDMVYLQEKLLTVTRELASKADRKGKVQTSLPAQSRRFLQEIIFNGRTDEAELQKEATELNLPLKEKSFQAISLQMDHYYHHAGNQEEEEVEKLRGTFYRLVNLFDRKTCFTLTESFNEFDLCLTAPTDRALESLCQDRIRTIREKVEGLPFTVSIGLGNPTMRLGKILGSFNQARAALDLKFFKGDNQVYRFREVEQYRAKKDAVPTALSTDALLEAIGTGKTESVSRLIDDLGKRILAEPSPKPLLSWISTELLLETGRRLEERELTLEEVIDDPLKEWRALNAYHTAEGFLDRLKELLTAVAAYVNIRKEQHSAQILDQSMKSIRENFTDGTYSLERAAEESCMSPSYFAVIFKQETGQTFNRYLTKLRIDKAKDLILYTDMKSYEIGPKVGYDNPSYFSTVFKKATGLSPSEYRKEFS